MWRIWKYELGGPGLELVMMPRVHQILDVQAQNDRIVLWALVDDTAEPKAEVWLETIGTGWVVPIDVKAEGYIGTVQAGVYVWHVFQVPEP